MGESIHSSEAPNDVKDKNKNFGVENWEKINEEANEAASSSMNVFRTAMQKYIKRWIGNIAVWHVLMIVDNSWGNKHL